MARAKGRRARDEGEWGLSTQPYRGVCGVNDNETTEGNSNCAMDQCLSHAHSRLTSVWMGVAGRA